MLPLAAGIYSSGLYYVSSDREQFRLSFGALLSNIPYSTSEREILPFY